MTGVDDRYVDLIKDQIAHLIDDLVARSKHPREVVAFIEDQLEQVKRELAARQ